MCPKLVVEPFLLEVPTLRYIMFVDYLIISIFFSKICIGTLVGELSGHQLLTLHRPWNAEFIACRG